MINIFTIILILHIIFSLLLIVSILLQVSNENTIFCTSNFNYTKGIFVSCFANNFLFKITTFLSIIFFITNLSLIYIIN